jgi:hypothetical protein
MPSGSELLPRAGARGHDGFAGDVGVVHVFRQALLLADAGADPLQDQVGNLEVVLVLHDHVAVAANAAV